MSAIGWISRIKKNCVDEIFSNLEEEDIPASKN
jgi:hypothetical protein